MKKFVYECDHLAEATRKLLNTCADPVRHLLTCKEGKGAAATSATKPTMPAARQPEGSQKVAAVIALNDAQYARFARAFGADDGTSKAVPACATAPTSAISTNTGVCADSNPAAVVEPSKASKVPAADSLLKVHLPLQVVPDPKQPDQVRVAVDLVLCDGSNSCRHCQQVRARTTIANPGTSSFKRRLDNMASWCRNALTPSSRGDKAPVVGSGPAVSQEAGGAAGEAAGALRRRISLDKFATKLRCRSSDAFNELTEALRAALHLPGSTAAPAAVTPAAAA